MVKLEINRFGEMKMFVSVVELSGFSAAARHYNKTPSSVSKLITRLETRLSTRLLNRSTRGLQLTPEGRVFYKQCIQVLSSLEEAERSVLATETPAGHLRISTNLPIGRHFILPLISEFLESNKEITLDITLTDKVIDLMEEYTDIAIRSGPMKDSCLIARKLGETSLIIVGSPHYLNKHGTPKTPKDLNRHNLLRFNFSRTHDEWPFFKKGVKTTIKPKGKVQVSDGESMRQLALSGAGLARLANFQVEDDINAGRLITLLQNYSGNEKESLHAVFLGQGDYLPARIRVFLDYLVEKIKL